MDIALVVLLALAGIVLLIVEMFLIPGVGIAGVVGTGSMIGAVVWAYYRISALAGHITLAATVVFAIIGIVVFLKSRALEKMSLDTKIDSNVTLAEPGKKIEELKK